MATDYRSTQNSVVDRPIAHDYGWVAEVPEFDSVSRKLEKCFGAHSRRMEM